MFSLLATFSDGHSVKLTERYDAQFRADRAAQNYIRDFSDPCGLGVHVSYVSVIKEEVAR
jgi:hypothetical protein